MRPVYGRSPWIDLFPKSRVPSHPKLKGHLDTEVVVVGGGLTGCLAAYAFAVSGVEVVLLEADRIGRGASGASSGWITDTPDQDFAQADAALGRRAARHAWQSWRRAALDFEALLRRLEVKCQLGKRLALRVAVSGEQAEALSRDLKRRRDAGLEGQAVPVRAICGTTGFAAAGALRTKESAVVDPYRTTLGLAAAALARGAAVFERSPVTRTAFTRDDATVTAGTATVRAKRVVVATGQPGSLFAPLARHLTARTAYLVLTEPVPARLRTPLGTREHLLRDAADPAHRISWWDDERLLVSGADGESVPARTRDATLVQRTGQLMYELSTFYPDISGLRPAYGWDRQYGVTATGLPLIGPHRNYPHHLFAWGATGHSLTGAYLASRILLRHHLEEAQAADEVFGFGR